VIALREVAVERGEGIEVVLVLDAFGDNLEVECVRELDGGALRSRRCGDPRKCRR
jgi:hypothetical protein